MELAIKIAVLVLAAAVGEGINEFFFIPWLDMAKGKWNEVVRVQLARIWSGLVGVAIAWELGLSIFALLGVEPLHPIMGYVLTGLLIGRGSNYVHEFINRFVTATQEKQVAQMAQTQRLLEDLAEPVATTTVAPGVHSHKFLG